MERIHLPLPELREIVAEHKSLVAANDRDEMAIPSYLHWNPLIPWLMRRRYEVIADFSAMKAGQKVLEFGCGTGLFLPYIYKKTGAVTGVDLFPQFAQLLMERLKIPARFGRSLPELDEDKFDLIIAADVLEHLEGEELTQMIETFHNRLTSTGRLIVSGPTENFVYKIGRFIAGFAGKGDYHHTNIDALVARIAERFQPQRTVNLPFSWLPPLFRVVVFGTKH